MIGHVMQKTNQRGMALLVVLWTLTLLGLLVIAFAQSAWLERHRVSNLIDASVAKSALQAGMSFGVAVLLHAQKGNGWARDGIPHEMQFAGSNVVIALQDTNGCVDINSADAPELQSLLGGIGVESDLARSLAGAIVDWRDPDDLTSPNGAEMPAYVEAGVSERPGNRPFLSTDELNAVLGMTPEIADRLMPLVTVFSNAPELNRTTAPEKILRADRSIPADETTAILARRAARASTEPFGNSIDTGSFAFNTEPKSATQADLAQAAEGPVFMITLDVKTKAGAQAHGVAVVWLTNEPQNPYRILEWRTGRTPPTPISATPSP
jgi:general secretion pathway protein K